MWWPGGPAGGRLGGGHSVLGKMWISPRKQKWVLTNKNRDVVKFFLKRNIRKVGSTSTKKGVQQTCLLQTENVDFIDEEHGDFHQPTMGMGALHWTGYLALSKKGSRPKMAFIYNIDTLHSVTLSFIIYLHRWISPSDLLDDMMRWSLRGWRADGGPLHIRDVGWAKVLTGHHSFVVSAFFWPLWGLIFGVIFWCQLSLYPESQPEESKTTTKDEQWQCAVTISHISQVLGFKPAYLFCWKRNGNHGRSHAGPFMLVVAGGTQWGWVEVMVFWNM